MTRRLRLFPLEDLLIAQAIPGFLLAVGWTAMYEVYHEDGAYYLSLLQEILEAEGLFPYFLTSAILMAFPLGMIVDSVRSVVGDTWLRLPERCRPAPAAPPDLALLPTAEPAVQPFLHRRLEVALLVPAKAAGNLAVVLLVLIAWFAVKIYRMQGWHVFSWVFIAGTPLVGLGLVTVLVARYCREMGAFRRLLHPDSRPTPPAPSESSVSPSTLE